MKIDDSARKCLTEQDYTVDATEEHSTQTRHCFN